MKDSVPLLDDLLAQQMDPPVHLLEQAAVLRKTTGWDRSRVGETIDGISIQVERHARSDTDGVEASLRSRDRDEAVGALVRGFEEAEATSESVADELAQQYAKAMAHAWTWARRGGLPSEAWRVDEWMEPLVNEPASVREQALTAVIAHLDSSRWGDPIRKLGFTSANSWWTAWQRAPEDSALAWFEAIRGPEILAELDRFPRQKEEDTERLSRWVLSEAGRSRSHLACRAVRTWLGDRLPLPSHPQTWVPIIDRVSDYPADQAWRPLVDAIVRLGWQDWAGLGMGAGTPAQWRPVTGRGLDTASRVLDAVRAACNLGRLPLHLGAFASAWEETGFTSAAQALRQAAKEWELPSGHPRARPRF